MEAAPEADPKKIEMHDAQYFYYTDLCRSLKKDVCGVPIRFLDAKV